MRALLSVLSAIAVTAGVGYFSARLFGFAPHGRLMLLAAGVCVLASVAGLAPLLLTQHASSGAISQAGLVGTVLHMMTAMVLGGALYLLAHPGMPFLYWLLGFYWTTLVAVASASVAAVKSAAANEAATKR